MTRNYLPGDEGPIIDCFLECMGGWPALDLEVSPMDHWRWKFGHLVTMPDLTCIAVADGKVVSHHATIPTITKIGRRCYMASQNVDMCTLPDFRGQGIMGQLLELHRRSSILHNISIDYAFPNDKSRQLVSLNGYSGAEVKLNQFEFVADPDRFFTGASSRLKRIGYRVLSKIWSDPLEDTSITASSAQTFGREVDRLFARASAEFDFVVLRNKEYLNWRYGDRRGGPFNLRLFHDNGDLIGYMVTKREAIDGTPNVTIVDILMDPDRLADLPKLIDDAVVTARQEGAVVVSCCLPRDHPYAGSFRRAMFFERPRYVGRKAATMVFRSEDKGLEGLLASPTARFHLTLGDTDWVCSV